jgi:hypothetical protein
VDLNHRSGLAGPVPSHLATAPYWDGTGVNVAFASLPEAVQLSVYGTRFVW